MQIELCPVGSEHLFLISATAPKCGRRARYEQRLGGGWKFVIPPPKEESSPQLEKIWPDNSH